MQIGERRIAQASRRSAIAPTHMIVLSECIPWPVAIFEPLQRRAYDAMSFDTFGRR